MVFAGFYNVFIKLIWWLIKLIAIFKPSFKQLVSQRALALPSINQDARKNKKILWMHCASLGEFEQGKAVLKAWKDSHPDYLILVSFFSASGYSKVKPGSLIDYTCYLPWDSRKRVRNFIQHFKPDVAIFVKYEFWFNYLRELNEAGIPSIFISFILRPGHFLLQWYGAPFRNELIKIYKIFVQDHQTLNLLNRKGFSNGIFSGDTRIDAVASLPEISYNNELIESFCDRENPVAVVGSSWEPDINLIASLEPEILEKYNWIIAPHKISSEGIQQIEINFRQMGVLRLSSGQTDSEKRMLIVDTIGELKYLYRFARWAYIGGGFGAGIHNTLEPAAYGIPVVFGPNYSKFREAVDMVASNSFFTVEDKSSFEKVIKVLESESYHAECRKKILKYIEDNRNATTVIMDNMERF